MTNAELIAELRGHIPSVPLTLLHDAADALEAAEKRIAELLPKEGEWIVDKNGYPQIICSICDVHIPMVAGWCMDAHIKYCPNCGARMQNVTDCHTLEEGERKEKTDE